MSLAKVFVLLCSSICGVQAIRRPEQDESCLLEAEFNFDLVRQMPQKFGTANITPTTPTFGGARDLPNLGNISASLEYSLGEEVEYLSTSHCQWMPATVTQLPDLFGFCMVSCKGKQLVPVQSIRKPSAGTTYEQDEAVYYLKEQGEDEQYTGCIHVPAKIVSVPAEPGQAVYKIQVVGGSQPKDNVPLSRLAKDPRVSYSTDQEVFCLSGTLDAWVPAKVLKVEGDGAVNVQYDHNSGLKKVTKEWVTKILKPFRSGGIDPCLQDAVEFDCYRKAVLNESHAEVWKISPSGALRSGSYGSLFEVTTDTRRDGVLKRAQDNDNYMLKREASIAIRQEVDVMKNLKKNLEQNGWWSQWCEPCLMHLLDSKPCVFAPHPYTTEIEVVEPLFSSFVMNRMTGDLHLWMHERPLKAPLDDCMPSIVGQVRNALICMHSAGFAHMDVKEANVLVKISDEKLCPEEVRLTDFGEAEVIGSEMGYRSEKDGVLAWYMPEEMFENSREHRTGNFKVHPKYDWCMFLSMFIQWHEHARPETIAKKWDYGWEGDCGKMGPNRRTEIRLQSWEEVTRESKDREARAATDNGMQPRDPAGRNAS